MSDSDNKQTTREPCSEMRACVEDWLDDLLDAETRVRVETHLGECSQCRKFFARRRALTDDLSTLGRAADALAAAAAPKATPRIMRWRSWSIAAATVLFFISAGLYLSEFRRARETQSGVNEPPTTFSSGGKESPQVLSSPAGDFGMTCPEGHMLVPMTSSNPRVHIVWLYEQTSLPETPANGEDAQPPASSG
jgi:hypothetical protein